MPRGGATAKAERVTTRALAPRSDVPGEPGYVERRDPQGRAIVNVRGIYEDALKSGREMDEVDQRPWVEEVRRRFQRGLRH